MLDQPIYHPGDKIKLQAATLNAIRDLSRESAANRFATSGNFRPAFAQATVVKVRNQSGAARQQFDVLGIDSPMFLPSVDQNAALQAVRCNGLMPAAASHGGKFCILQQPLAADVVGDAVVAGVTWARLYVISGTPTRAEITDAEANYLTPSETGSARVLWCETGTGLLWAVVRIETDVNEALPLRPFELKDALTPASTNVTAYARDWSGSAWVTDTGTEFEVYDPLHVFRGRAKATDPGSYGYAEWQKDANRWEIVSIQPHALRISCTADGTVATTDATFTPAAVTILQPTGAILMAAVTTVYNVFSWAIDNGGLVHATWSEANARWEAAQAKCPA